MYGFFSSYALRTVGIPIVSWEAAVISKSGIGVTGVTSKDRKLYVKPSYLYLRARRVLSGHVRGGLCEFPDELRDSETVAFLGEKLFPIFYAGAAGGFCGMARTRRRYLVFPDRSPTSGLFFLFFLVFFSYVLSSFVFRPRFPVTRGLARKSYRFETIPDNNRRPNDNVGNVP